MDLLAYQTITTFSMIMEGHRLAWLVINSLVTKLVAVPWILWGFVFIKKTLYNFFLYDEQNVTGQFG